MNSGDCLESYRLIWRTLLWDGVPDVLINALAERRLSSMTALTPDLIAELAAADAVTSIEDAMELVRLGLDAQRQAVRAAAVRAAGQAAVPRFLIKSEGNLVQVHVRQDLRQVDWFGLTPHAAGEVAEQLIAAARQAVAQGKQ